MVTSNSTDFVLNENFSDDYESFERIRPQRETVMPVSKCRSQAKGRRRGHPPKRSHKAPNHCRGAALRRNRKWK